MSKPPRQQCKICERRRQVANFSVWGKTQQICIDCERDIMAMAEENDLKDADGLEDAELHDTLSPQPPAMTPIKAAKQGVPYDQLDANIVSLVRALNGYPHVRTLGSCGGHDIITNASQWKIGTWYVKFTLPSDRSGWYLLEHLAWAINNDYRRGGGQVMFLPVSPPPYLNTPGKCLAFTIEGFGGENPDNLAQFLEKVRKYLTLKYD